MNQKIIILIVGIVIFAIIGAMVYFTNQNSKGNQNTNIAAKEEITEQTEPNTSTEIENDIIVSEENTTSNDRKILVVYYSASGNTQAVAQKIAENLGADIFEIVPVDEYSSDDLDWTDNNSRVTKEYHDESLRHIELTSTTVENWEEYDTILIGYPIWWGIAAWPVDTFVKANDFNEKTVIPFCTSASSGLGQSGELLADEANGGNWEKGQRFRENPTDENIKEFTDSIE